MGVYLYSGKPGWDIQMLLMAATFTFHPGGGCPAPRSGAGATEVMVRLQFGQLLSALRSGTLAKKNRGMHFSRMFFYNQSPFFLLFAWFLREPSSTKPPISIAALACDTESTGHLDLKRKIMFY